jgi:hypothetical protein
MNHKPVPDNYIVVRGGTKPLPFPGTPFSAAAGVDGTDAGAGIPHGQMRVTTAGKIRELGGTLVYKPELTKSGQLNERHVEVIEGQTGAFGEIEPNPVPKEQRIR